MNPILQALASGYGINQILQYLGKSSPQLATKITNAVSAGYTANEILKYVMKGGKAISDSLPSFKASDETLYDKMGHVPDDIANAGKVGLGLTALGAGYLAKNYFGSQGSQQEAQNVGQATQPTNQMSYIPQQSIPNPQPQGPTQAITPGQQIQQNVQSPIAQAMQPTQPNQVAQASQAIPQQVQQQPIVNVTELLEKSGLKKHVDELSKTQKDPNVISALLYSKFPKEMKAFQAQAGKNMEEAISDYIASNPAQSNEIPAQLPQKQTPQQPQSDKFSSPEARFARTSMNGPSEPKQQPNIEKNTIADSPEGVGEVKYISKGKAVIEVDGKLHKVNEEDLKPPEFSEDEVADAYDNLMKKIPEEHRSAFISWAGYDEDRNVLGFIPRGGKYEELHNITPKEATMIKEGKGVARTTGENREGLWISGEDTRGGVISQIIHDRRESNKEKEDKQLKLGIKIPKPEKQDRGMKPLFDEMAHARALSRTRENKKKDEERAKKKREKDEAKKRKKST